MWEEIMADRSARFAALGPCLRLPLQSLISDGALKIEAWIVRQAGGMRLHAREYRFRGQFVRGLILAL
jgi:hypothetical protein